jgi:RND superfamily putative drug exporter
VLFDAFVVRLILIPSVMTIFGEANWWLPGWLGRLLPHISVESERDVEAGATEIVDVPDVGKESEPARV